MSNINITDLISDSSFFNNKQIKQSRYIECLRWNNLVYVRTLKCASEFFYRNFDETSSWEKINWDQIDWSQDRVFSYIMDPVRRRHKGIAEFLIHHRLTEQLFDNSKFAELVSHLPFLDEHSAGMYTIYEDYADQIDWIPLSLNHAQGVKYTNLLLESYNHPLIKWNNEFVHTTDNYMKEIFEKIEQLWLIEPNELAVRCYFEKELRLFERVHTKFNYNGDNWNEISWLRDVRF